MEFVKSTAILTEHLGYAPIALIDDVINAVNDILYKCTSAMETFLVERYSSDSSIPEDEIEMGTAKLETLLESVVDRCFDKFELYVLRNLLVIPSDLINGGWVRLEHHTGVDFTHNNEDLTQKLTDLKRQLYEQKHLNYLLKTRSKRTARVLSMLDSYKQSLQFLKQPKALNDVVPINETIQFLTSQVTEMIKRIETINSITVTRQIEPSKRDEYVEVFARRALDYAADPNQLQDMSSGGIGQQEADNAQKRAEQLSSSSCQIH